MKRIDGFVSSANSTDIRNLRSLDLNDKVIDYIEQNELYYTKAIKERLDERRYSHSKSVARTAREIAKCTKPELADKAYIAGLLHDIGKSADAQTIIQEKLPQYKEMPKFSYHQFAGAYIANNIFGITDQSILNAIKYHATGNENMDDLSKIYLMETWL